MRCSKNKKLAGRVIRFMSICGLFICSSFASSAQTANGSVNPNPALAEIGDTFIVEVNIDPNGSNMTVAQVAMSYDPSVVQINTVSLSPSSPLNIALPGTTIDNTEGFFFIAGFGFSPATSPFTHVEIEFLAVGEGSSSLSFETEGVLATLFSAGGASVTGDLSSGLILVGEAFDCPGLSANIGDSCDDNDSETENDVVLADCTCQGTPICALPFPAVDEASLATVIGSNSVQFFWAPVEGQIGCQVQVVRALGTPFASRVFVVLGENANTFSLNNNLIIPSVTHAWRVRCGCSANPVIAGPVTSWQVFTLPSSINLTSSPNPTNGPSTVSFTTQMEDQVTLEVYDMNGRLIEEVYSGAAQASVPYRFDFDGSDLSQGVYIYRLTTANEVINEKFMISK
ncbi:MAG TPA: T9SS type A sorting domain-containing protein [Cryomorphaceae bacterium]|nr:T9SS type A sorting domain-containing protein [Cryomorphaceae bacterium]